MDKILLSVFLEACMIVTCGSVSLSLDKGFQGRYSIRKEHFVFQLYITKVEACDQGQFKCKIIYENKHDETFENHLKVKAKQWTVSVGDNTSFACKASPGYSVFVVTFQKGTNKIGAYYDDTSTIDKGFQGRYSIRKEHFVFQLYITKVEESDQGQYKCIIIYGKKHDETFEDHLKVQGDVVSDATLVSIKPQLLVTMPTVIAALWIHGL